MTQRQIAALADHELAHLVRQHNVTLQCGVGPAVKAMLECEIAMARYELDKRESQIERAMGR